MEEQAQIAVKEAPVEGPARMLISRIADVAFLLFLAVLCVEYYFIISTYQVPMWDAAVYLTNARDWLTNLPIYQIYRPPLISWIIAGIWVLTGEDWQTAKYLSAGFAIGAACVLYLTLRSGKGAPFALGVVILTMLNPQAFFYGTQIYTETLSLFFLVATLYLVKTERQSNWFLAGISVGLAFAARYPILLPAALLVVIESHARRNWQILSRAIIGAIPVFVTVSVAMFLKTGTLQLANAVNTHFSILLSPYYLLNSILTWGWVFLLVPLALILRPTYSDRYNRVFIGWFVFSLIFWSANATQDLRFTIQFTPAVNFLALLALETFVKNREPLLAFLRKGLVFLPKKSAMQTL